MNDVSTQIGLEIVAFWGKGGDYAHLCPWLDTWTLKANLFLKSRPNGELEYENMPKFVDTNIYEET